MTRLAETFAACARADRAALVTFVTGGDPSPAATPAILDALVAGGADVIELGMPFTDPMADGPAIQLADIRSLGAGTTTAKLLEIVKDFRTRHPAVPIVLMGYANPMVRRGPRWFAEACAEAGVDGVICVDIPPEEDAALGPALRAPASISSASRRPPPMPRGCRRCSMAARASSIMSRSPGITGLQQAAQASIDAGGRAG